MLLPAWASLVQVPDAVREPLRWTVYFTQALRERRKPTRSLPALPRSEPLTFSCVRVSAGAVTGSGVGTGATGGGAGGSGVGVSTGGSGVGVGVGVGVTAARGPRSW